VTPQGSKWAFPPEIATESGYDSYRYWTDDGRFFMELWRGSRSVVVDIPRARLDDMNYDLWFDVRLRAAQAWRLKEDTEWKDDLQYPSPV